METLTRIAWLLLVLVHAAPAAAFFAPALVERLYGVAPSGTVGALLVHRGALFLAVLVAALFGAFDPDSRRVCAVIVAISMVGYLMVYARAGLPRGELRKIAVVDLVGLVPLVFVAVEAWRG